MTLQRPIATSFNGGELSPRMGGRVDFVSTVAKGSTFFIELPIVVTQAQP